MVHLPEFTCAADVCACVEKIGFLPLFSNAVPGFSVEEHIDRSKYYFVDGIDGIWEWKEQIAAEHRIPYGKYLFGNCAFISREWFPALANYRRDGYDFDSRIDEGLISHNAAKVYRVIEEEGPMLTGELRKATGITEGFDGLIAKLQAQTYLAVREFCYKRTKDGRAYGWGIARLDFTERIFGELPREAYGEEPADSYRRMQEYLQRMLPEASEKTIRKMLK